MTLDLHIERLVIRGQPLTRREQARLVDAIQADLARRLDSAAGPASPTRGSHDRVEALGIRIAGSVHAALPAPVGPTGRAPAAGPTAPGGER